MIRTVSEMESTMPWNKKVLDNLDQLYWSPGKLGLVTVPRELSTDGSGFVVPKARIEGGKSIYVRGLRHAEWRNHINKDEELLNQVLEIALAIAPSSFIDEAFFAPLGVRPSGRIRTIGREAGLRHAELAPQQFTQHDGFYISDNAVVMMEMKLKANTSIEQYLKYCTLIALEELLSGRRNENGLIYLVPTGSISRTRRTLLLDEPEGLARVWDDPTSFTKRRTLLRLLANHGSHIKDVAHRLKIEVTTWDNLLGLIVRTRNGAIDAGDEALENLMSGMFDQICATADCGLTA